jgi:hypothetical protein
VAFTSVPPTRFAKNAQNDSQAEHRILKNHNNNDSMIPRERLRNTVRPYNGPNLKKFIIYFHTNISNSISVSIFS